MAQQRLGIIMNGVTGRMGTNQHLVRSIVAIRAQGGVALKNGDRVMPDPILVGRNEAKLAELAKAHGITEAVFLGTRVIVLTAGPARMADNFRVELPHPRTLEMKTSEKFGEYTRRIYRLLGME